MTIEANRIVQDCCQVGVFSMYSANVVLYETYVLEPVGSVYRRP